MVFYAVNKGLNPGIYTTWSETEKQVKGYKGAKYKKFENEEQAKQYVIEGPPKTTNLSTGENVSSSQNVSNTSRMKSVSTDTKAKFIPPKKRIQGSHEFESTDIAEILVEAHKRGKKREREENEFNEAVEAKKRRYDEIGQMNDVTVYHVFTDGACTNNGSTTKKKYAGIGIFCRNKPEWNTEEPFTRGELTNNRAELQAILTMLQKWDRFIKETSDHEKYQLCLWTDSKYALESLKNFKSWIRSDWTTTVGAPVKNQDLLKEIYFLYIKHPTVNYFHTRGHKGVKDNEEADRRASNAAEKQRLNDEQDL